MKKYSKMLALIISVLCILCFQACGSETTNEKKFFTGTEEKQDNKQKEKQEKKQDNKQTNDKDNTNKSISKDNKKETISPSPLKIKCCDSKGAKIKLAWLLARNVEYSLNGSTWNSYTKNNEISLQKGESVYYKADFIQTDNDKQINTNTSINNHFIIDGQVEASGNIMSLMDYSEICTNKCFSHMFKNCKGLKQAPELTATILADRCYYDMFNGCSTLKTAPKLPAKNMYDGCYSYMFANCQNLKIAPELPAKTLRKNCYSHMFYKCYALNQAPSVIPATIAPQSCCHRMFFKCTSLTKSPTLPASVLEKKCYEEMFWGCFNLTDGPSILPAKILADGCYVRMFYGCTVLKKAPTLPIVLLSAKNSQSMFALCGAKNKPILSYIK